MKSSSRIDTVEWALICALFLAVFAFTAFTANNYGPTYDEPHYASAGAGYAAWWAGILRGDLGALRADEIEQAWSLNHEHPPLQ